MNKTDLVEAMAQHANLSKADAGRALEGFIVAVSHALQTGDSVAIAGFGSFEVRERAERTGRNPKTGETLTIPASKAAAFKAGKALKDALN